ncbi:MAG: hypothetical protein JNL92_07965 [Opitutaceae bacterium]|nr:hypothetical protein [Opitutaceae bacterium]
MNETAESATRPPIRTGIAEVRYPLPEMLEELKMERAASTFAMEKLDQQEIGKLFKARNTRGKSKK